MYYIINRKLEEVTFQDILNTKKQFVAILTYDEWKQQKQNFDMGIDIEHQTNEILITEAEVNYDSITGTFSIPNRIDLTKNDETFSFALDEKGIVFIDDEKIVEKYIQNYKKYKKWRFPGLERFLYDFLNQIIKDDLKLMETYEQKLNKIKITIIDEHNEVDQIFNHVNEIRSDIRYLRNHYDQLIDLGEVLEENENGFFEEENLRFFRLFINKIERLHDKSTLLMDYTIQVMDIYKTHIDLKQNNIMTMLTIVTALFTPLMLIVGWYGMNFHNMPELSYTWGYPSVIIVSIIIIIFGLSWFKYKKWL
ncbi:CorA family divalent cation transporter [Methanosphaera sp. WGK6]|uniref:magnesium transporter CorA family protein n=1 Tax=Methanosphaera sp. WGK6 TaxID=1561964 RepID=UPI00084BFC6D|nr:CorA family divalent cation transporter [Methanosphaera sp. WGK6]OED29837.1 magnesium transporter CorA [Methanosphaera sp. WGK6]